MFEYIYKRRLLIAIIFTIVSFVSIIISQTGNQRINYSISGVVRTAINPVFSILDSINNGILAIWTGYIYLIDTRKEITVLKMQVSELKRKNFQYEIIAKKYTDILLDIKFDRSYDIQKIYAEIILDIPRAYSKLIIVNKGKKNGVRVNDGVINSEGAIGRVIGVDDDHASIMLINDVRSQYPVVIKRTGNKVMMSGTQNGALKIYFVPRELNIKIGDEIMTSSHAGIFSNGIKIGRIIDINKGAAGLFQEGVVKSSVNFNKLERVFIIKSPGKKTIRYLETLSNIE